MRIFNRLIFFLFLIFSFSANASTITYYTLSPPWDANARSPTDLDACKTYNPNSNATYRISAGNWCYRNIWGSDSFIGYAISNNETCPFGNTGLKCNASCDAPGTMVNGQCVKPQVCEQNWSGGEKVWSPSQGACVKYPNLSAAEFCAWSAGKSMGGQMEVNSNSASGPSQFINNSQCVMTANTAKAECATRVNSDGLGSYRCKVTGSYSGEYNANGTNKPDGYCSTSNCEEPPVKPPVPTPTPSEIKDSKPCVYTAGSDGVQSCTSSNLVQKEGTSNCGTVNGVWQCLDKKPTSQGIVIATKLQTETKPDGSTTTTKTDTAVSTNCAGIGDCKSTTTTTTTTTTKNPSGDVTGVTGSCTGPQCPDVNTNPDGDGDGFGDCTGDDCGSEGGSSAPGDLELDEVPTFGESASTFYGRISSSPIPLAMARIRAPTGGICPRYLVTTYIGDVDYSAHCDLIEDKRSLITLIAKTLWALLAAYILFG